LADATFIDALIDGIRARKTPCIVGIDPAIASMPPEFLGRAGVGPGASRQACAEALYSYSREILEAVADLVAAVKPQAAYFERYGAPGVAALEKTIARAKELGLLVILDVKRGDIGSTAEMYAEAYLGTSRGDAPEVDCMTLQPYLGEDSLEPFFKVCQQTGRGVFVCVRTSNPGAAALQDLDVGGQLFCERVADMLRPWTETIVGRSGYSGVGAVVGATSGKTAALIRKRLPRSFLLVPGIGAQGGDPGLLPAYFNSDGLGAVISSSRAINFPHLYSESRESGRDAIRRELVKMIETVDRSLQR
jgi:orotidine-5'-phosphate decarboxylase